jgi:hypothetical protein
MTEPSFADDVAFLERHGEVIVLGDRVAVSPTYQGRVMTSAAAPDARSLGWINRSFVERGATGTTFDNYGGEDRFWLGPEAGQYGLYFPPGADFSLEAWRVPRELQGGAWNVTERSATSVTMTATMTVSNWSGTMFRIAVERTVRLLESEASSVAYETVNAIRNAGDEAWTRSGGLVSIWILGMYPPTADTWVIVPFDPNGNGPLVNDRYFGKVAPDRLHVRDGHVLFRGDARHRSKIGVAAGRAMPVLGSFSAAARLLTVVGFDGPVAGAPYVDSMWERQDDPYSGDVVNSYNDGDPAGFYELETSSPGAELAPGESLVHTHKTAHHIGPVGALEPIAAERFGVSLHTLP